MDSKLPATAPCGPKEKRQRYPRGQRRGRGEGNTKAVTHIHNPTKLGPGHLIRPIPIGRQIVQHGDSITSPPPPGVTGTAYPLGRAGVPGVQGVPEARLDLRPQHGERGGLRLRLTGHERGQRCASKPSRAGFCSMCHEQNLLLIGIVFVLDGFYFLSA